MQEIRVEGRRIVSTDGKPILLRGVNLSNGLDVCDKTFVRESDIAQIANWGANCVRFMFHFAALESDDNPYVYRQDTLDQMDRLIDWCEKYGVYCLLDFHMAQGGVNKVFFTYKGKNELWSVPDNQKRFLALWNFLAERYHQRTCILYDVLNEPEPDHPDQWNELAAQASAVIRKADPRHIIHVESMMRGRIELLQPTGDPNTIYGRHYYWPLALTRWKPDRTGMVPMQAYPGWMPASGKFPAEYYDRERMAQDWQSTVDFQNKHNVPIIIGEFGAGPWRVKTHLPSVANWLEDVLYFLGKYEWSWTWFYYKMEWRGRPHEFIAADWFSKGFDLDVLFLEIMAIVDRYGEKEELLERLRRQWRSPY